MFNVVEFSDFSTSDLECAGILLSMRTIFDVFSADESAKFFRSRLKR